MIVETTKKKRKRQGKPKVENLYKILGVRSNSKPEKIKQAYIQQVKQYPPEQFPEEFQRIRRAYETLRDPLKREEYDLMRKYGGSLEKMMEEAVECMEQENWDQAEKMFSNILKIAPKAVGARIGLAQIQLNNNDLDTFDKQMEILFEEADSVENKVKSLAIKAKVLNDMDFPEKALDVLILLGERYPDHLDEYRFMFIQVYQALGRGEDALKMIELELPALETQEPDHIFIFIEWVNAMIELGKWQLADKIQKRVRKFLKSLKDEDDKLMAASALISEYEGYYGVGAFREAKFYMDLLYALDPKHPLVRHNRSEVQELARVQKEMGRMAKDDELFPLVSIQAMEWFVEEFSDNAIFPDMISPEILQEFNFMDEEYAAGIKRLKKKYPLTYRRYQEEWEELYEEKTSGLNREARRRLK
ncbi:hypothetical protein EJA13_05400 [Bacillus canaveralius]|nr:hypothetical protein EJA13_05400 [Bacillus canaveralius]